MHLIVDGRLERRISRGELLECLGSAPEAIGMTKIMPETVAETPTGLSGHVIIAESHLHIELNYQQMVGFADAFSCKPFPPERFVEVLATIGFRPLRQMILERGLEYLEVREPAVAPPRRAGPV